MKYQITLDGRVWEVAAEGDRVTVDGTSHLAELRAVPGTPNRLLVIDGRSWSLPVLAAGRGRWDVLDHGERRELLVLDERQAHIRSLAGSGTQRSGLQVLKAPMPGLVVRVLVEPGQKVVEGTGLIVLEAMKMENELKATGPAAVAEVSIRPGQTVERGQELIRFAAEGSA